MCFPHHSCKHLVSRLECRKTNCTVKMLEILAGSKLEGEASAGNLLEKLGSRWPSPRITPPSSFLLFGSPF